jgi:hypothetical protein
MVQVVPAEADAHTMAAEQAHQGLKVVVHQEAPVAEKMAN